MSGSFDKILIELGVYLKEARENHGLTQSNVAKSLNYTTAQYISNWERGLCPPPSKNLRKIVDLYNIKPHEFKKKYLSLIEWALDDTLGIKPLKKRKIRKHL